MNSEDHRSSVLSRMYELPREPSRGSETHSTASAALLPSADRRATTTRDGDQPLTTRSCDSPTRNGSLSVWAYFCNWHVQHRGMELNVRVPCLAAFRENVLARHS